MMFSLCATCLQRETAPQFGAAEPCAWPIRGHTRTLGNLGVVNRLCIGDMARRARARLFACACDNSLNRRTTINS